MTTSTVPPFVVPEATHHEAALTLTRGAMSPPPAVVGKSGTPFPFVLSDPSDHHEMVFAPTGRAMTDAFLRTESVFKPKGP